jgi:hypothetical protein
MALVTGGKGMGGRGYLADQPLFHEIQNMPLVQLSIIHKAAKNTTSTVYLATKPLTA